MKKPSIFNFKSSRVYLRAAVEFERERDRKYSLAYFSARIGRSAAYLKLALSGKRELSVDTAAELGRALRLNALERAYLITLTLQESAESPALRAHAANQLVSLKREGMDYVPDRKLASVFENSLAWELFSLVGVEGFESDFRWIQSRLRRREKSSTAVAAALNELEKLGAVRREGGKWHAGDIVLKHGFDVNKIYLVAARRLIEQLTYQPADREAYFDAFCLILSEQEYEQIRAVLEDTKIKVGQIVRRGKESPGGPGQRKTRIAYFNSSLFWAST